MLPRITDVLLTMPELPEVETTRLGIVPHVTHRQVVLVHVRQPSLRWPVSEDLSQSLTGSVITAVSRRGKYLLFETRSGRMMIHLGMSGSLRIVDAKTPIEKHDHVDIGFDDGYLLRYRDPRRFGSIFWLHDTQGHALIDKLGPEPLLDGFDGNYLYEQSRGKQVAVKLMIMNGEVVVGVGNIYANEALFAAGIKPDRKAGSISKKRYEKLGLEIKYVLAKAIEAGGTTLKDFVREDGQPGYFKQELKVYGRGTEPCVNCGSVLRESRLGQRATVFCTKCQT